MPGHLDDFLPEADIAESHGIDIHAPADRVFELACQFDLMRVRFIRAIFRAREKMLGAHPPTQPLPRGLVPLTQHLGWRILHLTPGRELVMGAVTQPWQADVVFRGIPPTEFRAFGEPDCVKIVWTLEAEPLGPALTRLRTQTRVLATDDTARKHFRRYWRYFGAGIVLIRWLALPAIRRQSEASHTEPD